jgi:hypothetical protein
MPLAIFGIENTGLNLLANLFVLSLVVLYLAVVVWTYSDARRRIADPMLVTCATLAAFFPIFGPLVYLILRPPDYLEDARERELEIAAAEARLVQLNELSCPHCHHPVERAFLRCPSCHRRLKEPCVACGKPLDPRWQICPYCEHEVGQPPPRRRTRAPAPAPARAQAATGATRQVAGGAAPARARPAGGGADPQTRGRPEG